jgi:hypothetical protein
MVMLLQFYGYFLSFIHQPFYLKFIFILLVKLIIQPRHYPFQYFHPNLIQLQKYHPIQGVFLRRQNRG